MNFSDDSTRDANARSFSIREGDDPSNVQQPKRSRMRRAIIWSVVAHVIGLSALLFWYLPNRHGTGDKSVATSAPDGSDESTLEEQPNPKPNPAPLVPPEQIEDAIDKQIAKTEAMPDEEKLSKLEQNLKRLDSIANEESVKQVTEKISSSLGLDSQQYQPKTDVPEGEFDSRTGQLSDVTRSKDNKGRWAYQATMVDAEGRKMKVPMSPSEGETVYQAFQQMKKYPMAAGIYRSVVMPMIQKMMEAESVAKKAAIEAQRMQAEQDLQTEQDANKLDF